MQARQGRIKGYVLGADKVQGETVWKVRVQDETSKYDGKKFVVASVRDNISLAGGLEVTFLLGQFREKGQAVQKAIDVRLFTGDGIQEASSKKVRTADDSEPFHIVVTRVGEEIGVHFTQEAEEDIRNFYPTPGLMDDEQEELVCIVPFNIYDWTQLSSGEGIVEGFIALRSLMLLRPIQETVEAIATATVRAFAEKAS
ncbi:MAG: hypothetical protein QG620_847 [Patescibacteria group bacterium]|nr:hypothetical protein [Patescibacteria group bacterium]